MTRDDRLEVLAFLEKEEARLVELRLFFHHKGDKATPVLDRKIRAHHAAILALTDPFPAAHGHTCGVLGRCDGGCR